VDLIESDFRFLNLSPMGEPQLGRRGLIGSVGGKAPKAYQRALLWALNLADGHNSVIDIAERSGLPFDQLRGAIEALIACGLLEQIRSNAAKHDVDTRLCTAMAQRSR